MLIDKLASVDWIGMSFLDYVSDLTFGIDKAQTLVLRA
jgi:hypothetical protein